MQCPSCQSAVAPAQASCPRCGTATTNLCPDCRQPNLNWAAFCGYCGARIVDRQFGSATQTARLERRQLTVAFCDVVDSTKLSMNNDPEVVRNVIRLFHLGCSNLMRRFGGFVAQYLGDGVLVYFGYPHAGEDDAERAVRAALELVETAGRSQLASGFVPQIRIGIATGIVVVGDL